MITTVAKVVKVASTHVTVVCQRKSACGACSAKASCGVDLLSKALPSKDVMIDVITDQPVAVGSIIEIGIPENMLLAYAKWIYLFPLILAITVALSVDFMTGHEPLVIISSLLAAALGFYLAKRQTAKLAAKPQSKPRLLRVVFHEKVRSHLN